MSTFHQIARSIDGSEEVRKKIALLQNLYDSAVRDFSREHLNLNRLKMEHVEIIKNSQISAAKITRMKTEMEKLQL
uniref:Uncharacterized protein n=1 Tax=Panagrolaimus sp. JU765 TaxID=591449 RepID=A0AC34RHM6_9BILA